LAINNTTGTEQTAWPGAGNIVHLRPVGAGDNAADTGTFADIDDVTPNDATDFINLDPASSVGDYTITNPTSAGIGTNDTVVLVHVGVRAREETSAVTGLAVRLKSASGGTTTETAFVDVGSTPWITNPGTNPFIYRLTSYVDPSTSTAWTVTGTNSLANAQIGVASNTDNDLDVTALWALVEYVPDEEIEEANSGSLFLYGV
jgi:hypothetical protein